MIVLKGCMSLQNLSFKVLLVIAALVLVGLAFIVFPWQIALVFGLTVPIMALIAYRRDY